MTTEFCQSAKSLGSTMSGKIRIAACIFLLLALGLNANAANTIVPLYGNSGGAVSAVAVAPLAPGWVVTAACNVTQDEVEVIVWHDTGAALAQEGSSSTPEACWNVAITTLNSSTVITANSDAYNSQLGYLTAWSVSSTGSITPEGTPAVISGNPYELSITALTSGRVVTATTYNNLSLAVTSWQVASDGTITQESNVNEYTHNFVWSGSIVAVNSGLVVTASQIGDAQDLQLTSWAVGNNYILQQGSVTAGVVDAFFPVVHWYSNEVLTPVSNGQNDLEVMDWTAGSSVKRLATGTGVGLGSGLVNTAACIIPGDYLVLIPVNTFSGNLSVQVWTRIQSGSGFKMSKIASYNSSWPVEQSFFALGAAGLNTHRTVTAYIQNSTLNLELEVWQWQ